MDSLGRKPFIMHQSHQEGKDHEQSQQEPSMTVLTGSKNWQSSLYRMVLLVNYKLILIGEKNVGSF